MIHWTLQSSAQVPELVHGAVPDGVLSAAELERLGQFTADKRRREWLLGHYTAKQLVQRYLERETGQRPPLDALVIGRVSAESAAPVAVFDCEAVPMDLPAGSRWVSSVPLVSIPGRKAGQHVPVVSGMHLPISLSISHAGDTSFCALYAASNDDQDDQAVLNGLSTSGQIQIGADIERIETRPGGFVQAYFSADEIVRFDSAPIEWREVLINATWSAKEAVLKALHLGLAVDTRRVSCLCRPPSSQAVSWSPIQVYCDPTLLPEVLQRANRPVSDVDLCNCTWNVTGWWRREGQFVLTLAALQFETP